MRTSQNIKVIRMDTGQIFESISKCEAELGIPHPVLRKRLEKGDGKAFYNGIPFEYAGSEQDELSGPGIYAKNEKLQVTDPDHFLSGQILTFIRDFNDSVCLVTGQEGVANYIEYDKIKRFKEVSGTLSEKAKNDAIMTDNPLPKSFKGKKAIEASVIRQTAREMAEKKVDAYIKEKEKGSKANMENKEAEKANFDELIKEIECVLRLPGDDECFAIVKDLALQTVYEKGKNGWIK